MPSTSVEVSVPLAVGVPTVALLVPPASVTEPVFAPLMTAASLAPTMLILNACVVVKDPSLTDTVNESVGVDVASNAFTLAASGM